MAKAVIFDIDGTLVDSVDLHARAWQEAFAKFGKALSYESVRSQIGKGGDQLSLYSCQLRSRSVSAKNSRSIAGSCSSRNIFHR